MRIRILVLSQDRPFQRRLRSILSEVDALSSFSPLRGQFWDQVGDESADVLLIDYDLLPSPALESVASLCALPHEPEVVVLWENGSEEDHAKLRIAGCSDVLGEGLSDELLTEMIRARVEQRRESSVQKLRVEMTDDEHRLSDWKSASPVMRQFLRMVRRVIEPDSSLLILGETGVGKERLARCIHREGPRGSQPFIPVNVAAFPEALLEGELFGHEEGAFTGASGDRRGYFELAHGGTIFLDEIGELPRHLQVKLLRVLQERNIQPLGAEKSIDIDVRIMAATNRDLEEEIKAKRFRRDLYYRLSVVTLEIPPLRERREDIPLLLDRYLDEFRTRMGKPIEGFSPEAIDCLSQYEWPGNVRELINVVERALILGDGPTLRLEELPESITGQLGEGAVLRGGGRERLSDRWESCWPTVREAVLSEVEREYLVHHLEACRGRLAVVSQRTGIRPRTLYSMMKRHNLHKRDYRQSSGGVSEETR